MRIISQAELARWASVSRNAVSKSCKPGCPLHDATIDGRIDAEHALVRAFLGAHGVYELPPIPDPTAARPSKKKRANADAPTDGPQSSGATIVPIETARQTGRIPPELKGLEHMTIREIAMQYGSVDGFKRYVDSLKTISDYQYRDLRVRQQRGELVERVQVAGVVFPMIDNAFARLVSDTPESVSKLVVARCEAGGPETTQDVVHLIREAISRVLKNLKETATRSELLKHAN